MYRFMLDLQGSICLRCIFCGPRGPMGYGRDSRIRGRICLWLFVPSVIVCSIAYGSLLLRTFKTVFTRICCLILKTYRNIVCLKDSFVPT
jgi:hypothetical protein